MPIDQPGWTRQVDACLRQVRRANRPLAVLAVRVVRIGSDDGAVAAELEAELLRDMGLRLRSRVRASDSVAWLGGHLFGVVVLNVSAGQARRVATRLALALGSDYRLGERVLSVSVSTGLAHQEAFPPRSGAELVEQALAAP